MKAIITLFSGLLAAIAVMLSIIEGVTPDEGRWHQTFYGLRGNNICYEYEMKTGDMIVRRTEFPQEYLDTTFVFYDTTYVRKMAK